VQRAEIHALVGENGAGKSTLMKILAGAIRADSGTIAVDGRQVDFRAPIDAIRAGISVIYQEFMLCPNLSAADNVFLGHEEARTPAGFVSQDVLNARSREYLHMLGIDIDPRTLVSYLTVAEQQMVEIAKALSLESHVIVMDEPTAVLTQRETDNLYRVLRLLASLGIFAEVAPDSFALTPLSETLRSDVPGSVRNYAITETAPGHWLPRGRLHESVRPGRPMARGRRAGGGVGKLLASLAPRQHQPVPGAAASDLLDHRWQRGEPFEAGGIVVLVDRLGQLRRDPDRHSDLVPRPVRSRRQMR